MNALAWGQEPAAVTPANLGAIHLINLASRSDRYMHFVQHIRQNLQWPVPIVRHPAADARTWYNNTRTQEHDCSFVPYVDPVAMPPLIAKTRRVFQDLTPGALGCSLSHAQLLSFLLGQRDIEFMLICEDDAEWNPELKTMAFDTFLAQINAIPCDWDALFLGGSALTQFSEAENHVHLQFFWQCHAYIVRKSAALKLFTDIYPIREPIDYHFSRKIMQNAARLYMTKPQYFTQRFLTNKSVRHGDSNINTTPVGPGKVMAPELDFTQGRIT